MNFSIDQKKKNYSYSMRHYAKHDSFYETPLHVSEGLGDLVDSDGHLIQGNIYLKKIKFNISYFLLPKSK